MVLVCCTHVDPVIILPKSGAVVREVALLVYASRSDNLVVHGGSTALPTLGREIWGV